METSQPLTLANRANGSVLDEYLPRHLDMRPDAAIHADSNILANFDSLVDLIEEFKCGTPRLLRNQ